MNKHPKRQAHLRIPVYTEYPPREIAIHLSVLFIKYNNGGISTEYLKSHLVAGVRYKSQEHI